MWPRLVPSNNFVTDFPSTETSLGYPCSGHSDRKYDRQREILKYKLFASTYNVGGVPPSDDLDLEDWLDTKSNSYDIYILGFQEIVPLNCKNVLGPERNKISMKWNSLIKGTLNQNSLCDSNFQCVVTKQMVGISISVWVRGALMPFIRHASVSCIGCGFMGCRLGNKGSVTVRFFIYETSFCIICCHLASGGKEGDEMHRNSDVMEIFSRTSFPSTSNFDLPQKILEHDRIIMLGDLNYRISLPQAETRLLVEQKKWKILLEKDQLRDEINQGRAFEGWQEGLIEFTPTYKYDPNSDEYYGRINQNKKRIKKRAPAWCDRIIWRGDGLTQTSYYRSESKLSDHRPVQAVFVVEVDAPKANSLRSFFLSDRFDTVSSNPEF